jgi:hypothetical protein
VVSLTRAKKAISDAYEALKTLLKKKFGHENEVSKSIEKLEANPNSANRQGTLNEDITAVHADQDPEILKGAQYLLNQINAQPNGEQHIQKAIGNYIAQADRGSTASVNVDHPKE